MSLHSRPPTTLSERFDVVIPRAGGPQGLPGDYLCHSGRIFKLREGSWGLLRVHLLGTSGALRPLPGREAIPPPTGRLCPQEAPRKEFVVVAIAVPLPMLEGAQGAAYTLEKDRAAVLAGRRTLEPLVLHVNVGDCLEVQLRTETAASSMVTQRCRCWRPSRATKAGSTSSSLSASKRTSSAWRDTAGRWSLAVGERICVARCS